MVLKSGTGKVGYSHSVTTTRILSSCFMPSSCEGSFIGGQKVLPKDFADKIGSDMG